jgi:hypothetical protein
MPRPAMPPAAACSEPGRRRSDVATNYPDLIPVAVARDVIAAAEDESAVLRLGNTIGRAGTA